jgi:glycosyltransferase involved in cell wall biosynthesis
MPPTAPRRLRVAIVAASLRILGGQAVQAQRMLEGWRDDPDVEAWLVPVNPLPPKPLRWLLSVKFARTIVTQLSYWPLLFREVRRADVVHAFSASYTSFLLAPLPAVIVAKLLGRPVILNYHSGEAPDHLRRSAIARFVMRHLVDRNVVPSPFLREVLGSFGIDATVVANTVDLTRFAYRVRDPLRPRLLSTRNLEPLYNVSCTLRAFGRIQAKHPDASLTLVGFGSQDAELRALSDRLGLRNVVFAGRIDPSEIHRYYADADLYVQSSSIDNMPLSILEAFASGLPVVATRVGGVPAMVTDTVNGLLAPDDDDATVAAHVMTLLENPSDARRLAAAGYEACGLYQWSVVRHQWFAVYRSVNDVVHEWLLRLRRTTRQELAWRIRAAARIQKERVTARVSRFEWRRQELRNVLNPELVATLGSSLDRDDWQSVHHALLRQIQDRPSHFVLDYSDPQTLVDAIRAHWPNAPADAAARADRILEGRYDLLGYKDLTFGSAGELNWHLDPVHGKQAPLLFWADVPYLDPSVGDHKIIWELNRHQHWLQLGRALWLTGDRRYRNATIGQLESWLAANPPRTGINWASMLELGFRSLSWTWALHFLAADRGESVESPWLVDLLVGLDAQLTHVEHNLSHYFSPNTHLTGEALSLYVVGHALPELAGSRRWIEQGREILLREIDRQIRPDGAHAEGSTHYHRYTLDIYLFALLTALRTNDTKAVPHFFNAVTRLAVFMRAVADDRGVFPLIGDDDGGMLWPIAGRACDDVRDSLGLAAVVLDRAELAPDQIPEEAFWLAGSTAVERADLAPGSPDGTVLGSRTFPDAGIIVSRDDKGGHLVFDAGPHGYMNAGHAHADALSLTLSLRHRPLLVDPGTSTYTVDRGVRDRMRATMSHNTVVVDGRSQSEPAGAFSWRSRTNATIHGSRHDGTFDWIEASHDGYAPVRHRRTIIRAAASGWLIVDELLGHGAHTATTNWHFDPDWRVTIESTGCLRATHGDGGSAWVLHDTGTARLLYGDEQSGLGWHAPVYGMLVPAWCAQVEHAGDTPFSLVTWIGSADDAVRPSIERLPSGADGSITVRIVLGDRTSTFVVQPDGPIYTTELSGSLMLEHTLD